MAWADERLFKMDAALNRIEVVAQELQEIDAIADALLETAKEIRWAAGKEIIACLAYRLGELSTKAEDIVEIVNTGLTVQEAEQEDAG